MAKREELRVAVGARTRAVGLDYQINVVFCHVITGDLEWDEKGV